MVTGGSAGHSGLDALDIHEGIGTDRTWDVEVRHPDDAIDESKAERKGSRERDKAERLARRLDDDRRKLVNAANKFKAGETFSVLRDRAGLSTDRGRTALAECLDAGDLIECEVEKNGRREDGFRVPVV
jgi:hypothetical protein